MTDEELTVTDTAQDSPTPASDAATESETTPDADAKDLPEENAEGGEEHAEGEGAENKADEPDPKPKKNRKDPSERIAELTGKWRSVERENKAKQQEIERLQARLSKLDTAAPRREDFDDLDEYQAELSAYKSAQIVKQDRQSDIEDRKAELEASNKDAEETLRLAFEERQQDFMAKATDYHDVVNSDLPISDVTAQEILRSEMGPQIAYYLGKNRADAARIARITDSTEVARELARIEGRLSTSPPRRTTVAPQPVTVVAKGSGTRPEFDPATATVDDLAKRFREKWG